MDLLHWRPARTLARSETRRLLQLAMLLTAAVIVIHGLTGPRIAPRNLATVATWIHYRGLLVLGLVAVGNLFCTACPMMLLRDAGRRVIRPRLRWPRLLRRKWLAIVLIGSSLFAYELCDLWNQPRATAVLIAAYFGVALLVDLSFSGATFCKYLCPIGQFNFAGATIAPLELRARDEDTCRSCRTVDCIKGRREPETAAQPARLVARGCELGLFMPAKVGNLDCTMCFDCVRACPHDNIGLMTRVPGAELAEPGRRAGIGRLVARPDLAALAIVFTFGALLNAFAMTAAARAVQLWLIGAGLPGEGSALAILFLGVLVLLPLLVLGTAAAVTRALSSTNETLRAIGMRHVFALVPIGAGIWLAHTGFHLLTGALTIVPVTQSAVADMTGLALIGEPAWRLTGLQPGLVLPLQLGCVLLGGLGSAAVTSLIADRSGTGPRAALPWHLVTAILALAALWTLSLPMDMRGLGIAG